MSGRIVDPERGMMTVEYEGALAAGRDRGLHGSPREVTYDPDMPGMTLDEISAWVKKEEKWQSENL